MPSQNQIRERITNTIVEALKSGALPPWRRPWALDPNAGHPCNISGRKYRGINPLLLTIAAMRHGFTSKFWGTYNRWERLGGKVMKRPDNVPPGQWGTTIIFWSRITKTDENDDGVEEEKDIFFLKTFTVFNVDQVLGEDLDVFRVGHAPVKTPDTIITYEEADRVIEATGADIRYGGNQALYDHVDDYIQVPLREQFTAPEYYETIFHEMAHWSGHQNRLNRSRADGGYAFEELVAEIGSCFLASELGIANAERLPNHASYLQSWLKAMQNDHRFIFQAATQANKVADYILAFSRTPVEEREEALAQ